MAKTRTLSTCFGICLVFISGVSLMSIDDKSRNYNIHYQKSGELLKAASSNVPYSIQYETEESDYQPSDYAEAESASFGTYNVGGGGGQFLGNGYQGGYQRGIQGGLGYSGLNQYSNLGYSGGQLGGIGGLSGGVGGLGGGVGGLGGGIGGIGGYSGGGGIGIGQPSYYSGGVGGGAGGGGYVQGPYLTGGHHGGQQVSGGYVDKNQFESAKKNTGDENLEKVQASVGSTANQNSQGFNSGAAEQSSAKGDNGYYKEDTSNKNQAGDGKQYQGASNADKEGKSGDSENSQKSHKKGHVTKGFKSSHRKDEEEKTETFYDEAHDEAARKNFGEKQGSFGETSQSSFKGGQEQESLDAKAQGKEGHFNNQNKIDDSKAKKEEFGQKAFKENAEQLHKVNGLGAQTILGQQESSGEFHSKKPYGILPIHGDK